MKKCQQCGEEVFDFSVVCPNCGCKLEIDIGYIEPDDSDSLFWRILTLLFPIEGIILYKMWTENYPRRSEKLLNGSIIGFIIFGFCIVAIAICLGVLL